MRITNDMLVPGVRGMGKLIRRLVTKELGAAGIVMFIRQFENGYGNYTEERDETLKDILSRFILSF